MTQVKMTAMAKGINSENRMKGFWDDFEKFKHEPELKKAFVNQFLMLSVSEIGEACEALRKDRRVNKMDLEEIDSLKPNEDLWKKMFEANVKDTFEDEIADAIIRLMDLAGGMNINIGWHIENKREYNKTRPHKHGKKY